MSTPAAVPGGGGRHRTVTTLAAGGGLSLRHVAICTDTAAWSVPERPPEYQLVFVCSGVFRARIGSHTGVAEPAVAYLGAPAEEQSIAHRPAMVDRCIAIGLSRGFMTELSGGGPLPAWLGVTGECAVAHRVLAHRARWNADLFELTEMTARLVGGLLARNCTGKADGGAGGAVASRPDTVAARRELAESARELLATDTGTLGLRDVARIIGSSPYHLSRVFHAHTGMSLTAYRNRLRVHRALDALVCGEENLAVLAASLGFADQAHLTRMVRRECGQPPRELRRLLAAPGRDAPS